MSPQEEGNVFDVQEDGTLKEVRIIPLHEQTRIPVSHDDEDAVTMPSQTSPPPANGNGNGVWNLPLWARILFIYGPATAIALGMVINSEFFVKSELRELKAGVAQAERFDERHERDVNRNFEELKVQTRETNRLLLQLCMMQAKSDDARDRCLGR